MMQLTASPRQVSRYEPARTLVRRLLPLPGETRTDYLQRVELLKTAFREFNTDVANLCRWLMAMRPKDVSMVVCTEEAWRALVWPKSIWPEMDKASLEAWHRMTLDALLGLPAEAEEVVPPACRAVLHELPALTAHQQATTTGPALFARLRLASHGYRGAVMKAACDWIASRYLRTRERMVQNHQAWYAEKAAWEQAHPALTPEVREQFNAIFSELGVREKRPRICHWSRLEDLQNNCLHAGQEVALKKRHADICARTIRSFSDIEGIEEKRTFQRHLFGQKPNDKNPMGKPGYLELRAREERRLRQRPASKVRVPPQFAAMRNEELHREAHRATLEKLFQRRERDREQFDKLLRGYLQAVGLSPKVLFLDLKGEPPHCSHAGEECVFNQHTDLCIRYRELVAAQPSDLRALEEEYRTWRSRYLAPPRGPQFVLPSATDAPLPRIFGKGFFEVDLKRGRARLRVEQPGRPYQWLEFAMPPWPKGYSPDADSVEVTSAHLHFIGTRPRLGFRFDTKFAAGRITLSQDDIDYLRSHVYPRPYQDSDFLLAVRQLLESSGAMSLHPPLRVLAVDLGSGMTAIASFEGNRCLRSSRLRVVKDLATLTNERPPKPAKGEKPIRIDMGLRAGHLDRHLQDFVPKVQTLAEQRLARHCSGELLRSDMREETAHMRWMIRDWVRLNVRQILAEVEASQADLIVFESLRGARVPGRHELDAAQKSRLAFFPFGQIRRKVTEKAIEHGTRVVTVPYFQSSRFCSACHSPQEIQNKWKSNKQQGRFECERKSCGYKGDSDENAARVLGHVFWGTLPLPEDPHWQDVRLAANAPT
ncbi:MAG: hypothetical protein GEEBNDBF_00794 [bacterium]|nr:hypothetical protein [bacterium]